jgi:uncharacterized protein involved in outer membrane biogenesis
MKNFIRILIGIPVSIIIVAVVLVLFRNQIIKAGAGATIKAISGVDMRIGSLNVGLFRPAVQIKDLKLFNPGAFPEKLMMDMPELYVKYDLPAILKGSVHLSELKINLKEFVVVKTVKGEINVNSLQALQPKQGGGKPPKIQIDVMELNVGKVVYKEFRASGEPKVSEFKIDLHERYENITDPNVLVGLIVSKALRNTSIAGASGIVKKADNILNSTAGKLLNTTGQKASQAVGSVFDKLFK